MSIQYLREKYSKKPFYGTIEDSTVTADYPSKQVIKEKHFQKK
jgi:hypothetical protein